MTSLDDGTGRAAPSVATAVLPGSLEQTVPFPRSLSGSAVAWGMGVPLALLLGVFLTFLPALDAGYVYWDDDQLLVNNSNLESFGISQVRWAFTTSYAGHFQPLTWLSYILDYQIFDGNVFGYHLTNVLLHAVCTLMFYVVVRRLLVAHANHPRLRRSSAVVLSAGFAAALFGLHPLRVESVAWVAERRDVLSGALFLLAIWSYLRFVEVRGQVPYRRSAQRLRALCTLWYVGVVLFCVLSLLAKAIAVTLPVILLILDVYPLRRLGGRAGWWRGAARFVWIEKVPLVVLAAMGTHRAIVAQRDGGALFGLEEHDVAARLAQMCYGLVFYLRKALWPSDLSPIYEFPPPGQLLGATVWGNVLVLLAIVALAVLLRRRIPGLAAALACYFVLIVPVSGLVQSGPQLVADRYSYLSCLGLAALGGGALMALLQQDRWRLVPERRALLGLVTVSFVVLIGLRANAQAEYWQSAPSLWAHAAQTSPNSAIAHVNYADALIRTGLFDEKQKVVNKAIAAYRRGLQLNPNDVVALHHLGDVYRIIGDDPRAISHYVQALRLDPNRRPACLSLAHLLRHNDRPQEALLVLRDGLRRHPQDLEIMEYLARMLSTHPDAAVRNGPEAVELASLVSARLGNVNVPALMTLACAFAEAGRFEEALATVQRAVALADAAQQDLLIRKLHLRGELFRQGEPYHEER